MTTGIEYLKPVAKRKGRGPGKKPSLYNTSVRLPRETVDFFKTNYPYTTQAKMREILTQWVEDQQCLKAGE